MVSEIPKNEEEYIKYVTKSLHNFEELCEERHPYKKKEEEIFKEYYEDTYSVNDLGITSSVSYAKKSSKVLLRLLKSKSGMLFSVMKFSEEAFTDEVVNYIKENDRIDDIYFWYNHCQINRLWILKVKKHREFVFKLSWDDITDEMIGCLRDINFKSHEIDEYLNNNNEYPECLESSKFILFLLEESIDNIKYLKGTSISSELVEYLLSHNYKYKIEHNKELLRNPQIFNKFIYEDGNIDFILENDVEIGEENVERFLIAIKNVNHDCWNLKNKFLLQCYTFYDGLVKYLNLDNLQNLENEYLVTTLGRELNKLSSIFSDNDIEIIKREVVKNKYPINLNGIINNINLIKLKEIYDKLYQKDNKFNSNFNFYYFIKVMEYFSNNLLLVNELNNNEINDCVIDNLALVIANNDKVNYEQLKNYIEYYKKEIDNSNLSVKQKITKLLINKTRSIDKFLDDILNPLQLTYLQLEFSEDSIEYKLLENYIEIADLLKNINTVDDNDYLNTIYTDLLRSFNPKSIFDANVIRENILRLYSKLYFNMQVDYSKFEKKGKVEVINGREIIDINGEQFCLFIHNSEFHVEEVDFTGCEEMKTRIQTNYLCCEYVSDLWWKKLLDNRGIIHIYEYENPTSLISFGNQDIFVHHTKKPLIEALDKYVNPFDMACFFKPGYANTEFDFLRVDDKNIPFDPGYKIVKSKEEALKYIDDSDKRILIFDEGTHMKCLQNETDYMLENIETLNYKQIYRLLALLYRLSYTEYDVERIQKRVDELSEKERFILNDAMNRYLVNTKNKNKVK